MADKPSAERMKRARAWAHKQHPGSDSAQWRRDVITCLAAFAAEEVRLLEQERDALKARLKELEKWRT